MFSCKNLIFIVVDIYLFLYVFLALSIIIFAIVISLVSIYWFQDFMLGVIIGLAMVLNLILAGFAGTIIPIALEKMKIDPALASAVILTTITDVFGFLSFLGLATLFLI